jgi:hypothetical protein
MEQLKMVAVERAHYKTATIFDGRTLQVPYLYSKKRLPQRYKF